MPLCPENGYIVGFLPMQCDNLSQGMRLFVAHSCHQDKETLFSPAYQQVACERGFLSPQSAKTDSYMLRI